MVVNGTEQRHEDTTSAASWYAGQIRLVATELVAKPLARAVHLLHHDDEPAVIDLTDTRETVTAPEGA